MFNRSMLGLFNENVTNRCGGSFNILAVVHERLTKVHLNGTAKVAVKRNRYKLTIKRSSERFIPGKKYSFTVCTVEINIGVGDREI